MKQRLTAAGNGWTVVDKAVQGLAYGRKFEVLVLLAGKPASAIRNAILLSSRNSDLAEVDDGDLQTARSAHPQGINAGDEWRDRQYR